jgi:hypothetical protein
MTGPEKQLKLGVNFITRAKNILDNILKREKEKIHLEFLVAQEF